MALVAWNPRAVWLPGVLPRKPAPSPQPRLGRPGKRESSARWRPRCLSLQGAPPTRQLLKYFACFGLGRSGRQRGQRVRAAPVRSLPLPRGSLRPLRGQAAQGHMPVSQAPAHQPQTHPDSLGSEPLGDRDHTCNGYPTAWSGGGGGTPDHGFLTLAARYSQYFEKY